MIDYTVVKHFWQTVLLDVIIDRKQQHQQLMRLRCRPSVKPAAAAAADVVLNTDNDAL